MAKPPALRRLDTRDLPAEVQPWVERLVRPLNEFMDGVHAGLSGHLAPGQNLAEQVVTITLIDGPPAQLTRTFSAAHTAGNAVITAASYGAFVDIGAGFAITSASLPANTTILSWDIGLSQITCSANATATGSTNATWTSPLPSQYPTRISLTMPYRPVGAHVLKVVKVSDRKARIGDQVWLDWYYDDAAHQVVIKDIVGLTHGTRYEVTIRIIGG